MKILVLGCGRIGSVAVKDLAESPFTKEIVIADKIETRAKKIIERTRNNKISWIQLDVQSTNELVSTLGDFDLALGFLPGRLGYSLAKACIKAGTCLIDVSYMPEDCLTLHHKAIDAGVIIIPDCGFAPGITNILIGNAVGSLDKTKAIRIFVGGLPERPIPPLNYVITWSPENLIDEYTRKARIIQGGKLTEVESLTGLEELRFPGLGTLEAFYTDGLRTLPSTIKNVESMYEKTLRYPGHAEKIKLLKALGFFNEEKITIEGLKLSPRKITAKLFENNLQTTVKGDLVVMIVEVSGKKDGQEAEICYQLLDRHDEQRGISAMARSTAYTASIVAQLLLQRTIMDKGVIPPEILGTNPEFFSKFMGELRKREIKINETAS
ncbi:MAG: saccharopine dehydrogenase family protein [Candidatus Bathyarchaeota archaeon]|jgi:saccharopine dehydrogenase-like NADP-dependent oxidoreductase